jgi:hypothetical protein
LSMQASTMRADEAELARSFDVSRPVVYVICCFILSDFTASDAMIIVRISITFS